MKNLGHCQRTLAVFEPHAVDYVDDLAGQSLVLRHKTSGKIASRRDQRMKALVLEAQCLNDVGLGAGITSLLLPTSPQDKVEMSKIGEIYEVSRVKTRSGKQSKTTVKKSLQTAIADDELIANLALLYEGYIGEKLGPHTISAKAFTRWLKKQLKDTGSKAYGTVLESAPILLEGEYGDRWWADTFGARKKTQS